MREFFYLEPDTVYLNHGAFGACPKPIFEQYQKWQLELERHPMRFFAEKLVPRLQKARMLLGEFLGANANNLVYVPNTTVGLNTIARSIALKQGHEVLSTNLEYGAMNRMWDKICKQSQAHYIHSPISLPVGSAEQVIETVWSRVTERTKILFISHITSTTAITFPIRELINRARLKSIITIIDGAHVPGQYPIELDNMGVDYYVGNCHKWMMTPRGSAFLYARPEMQKKVQPLIVSWGEEQLATGISSFIDNLQYLGTRDIAAYLAVPRAIEFMKENKWRQVVDRCRQLVVYARNEILKLTEEKPLTPDTSEWFQQMAAMIIPQHWQPERLQQYLYGKKIEIPIRPTDNKHFLRISIQAYNSQRDVDILLEVLEEYKLRQC